MNALNDVIEQPRVTPRSTSQQQDAGAGMQGMGGGQGPAVERTLRRTGRKPIRFEGWQLIEAAGSGRAQPDLARPQHVSHHRRRHRRRAGGAPPGDGGTRICSG